MCCAPALQRAVAQEIYALLVTYQALRIAMSDATSSPGAVTDHAGFSIALNTAHDQVILATGIIATTIDLVGKIGRAVLDHLLPARRNPSSPRIIKRAISKHRTKGDIDRNTYKIEIDVTINTG